MGIDEVPEFSSFLADYDDNGECGQVTKVSNEKGVYRVKDKRCTRCNNIIPQFELKCKECGQWLENDVFKKLNEREVDLIVSQGLTITTPSLISLQNAGFFKLVSKEYEDFLDKIKTDLSSLRISLYLLYCFADALYLSAHKKAGREASLRDAIYEKMVRDFGASVKIHPGAMAAFKGSLKGFQEIGIWIFQDLERVWHGETLTELTPAAMFVTAELIGKIIASDENSIPLNLELFTRHMHIFTKFSGKYSKLFIVEDDDFKWARMIET